jgi:O-glycosyl hydrolase
MNTHRHLTQSVSFTVIALLVVSLMVSSVFNAVAAPPVAGKPPTATPTTGGGPTATPTSTPAGGAVNVWLTTGDKAKLLHQEPNITFGADTTTGLLIHVNENHTYQQVDGFGAALTDSSAWLISNELTTAQRDALMNSLFNPTTGIGMSYVRLPMGASDFTNGAHYTYDDMPPGQTDPNLTNFSISHDLAYIVPVLQQALSLNPTLKVMGSPWSAPAWMKTNGSLYRGGLQTQYYGAYANYIAKFVDAYQAQGITINSVTVQNEPQAKPGDYPGMWLTPNDEISFVANNLGPALNSKGAKIIVLDHNWALYPYPITVLSNASAKNYIAGSAFHCYGAGSPTFQTRARDVNPDRDIYFTECTSGLWATNWADNLVWDLQNLIIGGTRNWARTVIKWNIALNENSGPHNGGCTNCTGLVTINSTTGAVTYNHDYYSIGHASKFVTTGAYRIASSSLSANKVESVAFKNPDGSKVLIVVNADNRSQTFKVRWGGQSFQYSLPSKSVVTFKWSGTPGAPSAPAAPTSPTATAQAGKITLKWEFSYLANTYNIKRATVSGGPYTTIKTGQAIPEYVDTSVTNGTTYYYVVSAVNGNGESANSTQVSATPNLPPTISATSQIEVENYNLQYGIGIEPSGDTGGGENIAYTEDGDYLAWNNVNFGAGVSSVSARVASGSQGGTLEFRIGSPTGTLLGSIAITNTGGFQTWTTKTASVSNVTGVQALYVVFKDGPPDTSADGITNLNWIKFQ